MTLLILLLIFDAIFLVVLGISYHTVTRRRARIYVLVDHLEAMARRGLPLPVGLRTLGRDLGGYFGTRLAHVARRVEEGETLGEAFASCPHTLPPILQRMVDLGARSGNATAFLGELRRSYRRIEELPYRSAAIILYPAVLTITISIIVLFVFTFIVPKYLLVYESLNLAIPLIGLLIWLRGASQFLLAAAVLLPLLIFLGHTPNHFGISPLRFMKGAADRVVLLLPILRGLGRSNSIYTFSVSTGLLLRAGATLPEAARMSGETEPNSALRPRYERLAAHLEEGGGLTEFCRRDRWFPADFLWFAEGGEASGRMSESLLAAAEHFDTKFQYAAQVATRTVIPIFVVLNGLLVLAVWCGTVLPILYILKRVTPF